MMTPDPEADDRDVAWQRRLDAGKVSYAEGRYAEAQAWLELACKGAEAFGEGDPRLTESLDRLGNLYLARGRLGDAERIHLRVLRLHETARDPVTHRGTVANLNNLAGVY